MFILLCISGHILFVTHATVSRDFRWLNERSGMVRTGLRSTGAAPMSFRSAAWRREIFSQSRRYVMQKFRQSLLEYFSPDSVRIRNDRISRTWIPLCHFYSYHERMVHDQCRSTKKCVLSDRSDQLTQTCHTSQWSDRSCSEGVDLIEWLDWLTAPGRSHTEKPSE